MQFTTKEIIFFTIFFIAPMIYWRTLSYLAPNYMNNPFVRTKTKLQFHHLHFGILIVLTSIIALLIWGSNIYLMSLLGLGLGLILDLFIPSLLLETDREIELRIYKKTFIKTLILFLIIIFIILALFFTKPSLGLQ